MITRKHYTDKFKQDVIQKVLDGKMSREEVQRKYSIKGHSSVTRWMNKNDVSILSSMKTIPSNIEPVKSLQELQAENRRLRQELDFELLRVRALNVMIDIAEDQFKIPIRKKPGAKQLKK
jgi:transposase-like protein